MSNTDLQLEPTIPSSNAVVFSFPWWMRGTLILGLCCQLSLLGFAIYGGLFIFRPPNVLYILWSTGFFLWLIVVTIRWFSRLDDRVELDDLEIRYLPSKGAPTTIRWADVASVSQHNPILMPKYLKIAHKSKGKRIKLYNKLQNFETLDRLVREHAIPGKLA